MLTMSSFFFRFVPFIRFYVKAVTKYQLHSPFVFELAETVLDNKKWYYAFREVEVIRRQMLRSKKRIQIQDSITGQNCEVEIGKLADRSAGAVCQGRMLFRLANWLNPTTMLELAVSADVGPLYLASGASESNFVCLEENSDLAQLAQVNLAQLRLKHRAVVQDGLSEIHLQNAMNELKSLDLVFFHGERCKKSAVAYFEQCLPHAQAGTVFVFDNVHGSPEMQRNWDSIQQHPRVTLCVDFFELSLAFINPDFKEKQHLCIVPASWKIWRFF
jgi:predicted O-methyltransferase YrrM